MIFSTAAVIFLAAISAKSEAQSDGGDVIVTTNLGRILGTSMTSRLGEKFLAFRGIRYAKAPVEELRFEAPVPVEKWTDLFNATEDGPMCPQRRDISGLSEDCLRLNVYTRELPPDPSVESFEKKPVIIYFHPGGFYSVSGQSKNFAGPQLLMDRNIVLVTANYRLSSLGFLATGTMEAPGNAGLKDQVLVLKWVQEHISRFGGDPDSVTLMGYSAGAMSVTLHMVSPMSRDLFHKAIVMSGAATSQFEIPNDQLNLAKKQARLLNCSENNITELVQCLKQKSMTDFVDTISPMFEFGSGQPIILWSPVVEQDFGQERFLVEDPVQSYLKGEFMKIPIIAGITKDEFVGAAIDILEDDNLRQQLNSNFDTYAPICFLYERGTSRSHNITQELRKTFLGNQTLSLPKSIEGLGYLFSDGVIGFGMHRFVQITSIFTSVWNYKFAYKGRYSHLYYPEDKPYGVVHHDDLLYLFAVPGITPLFTQNDPEHITVERLTRMWTQFALTGDPNKPNDEYLKGLNWTTFTYENENYLDIGTELEMKQNLYTDRFAVWERLFPLKHHHHHHHHHKHEGHGHHHLDQH